MFMGVSTSFTVSVEGICGIDGIGGIEISGISSLGRPKAFAASRDKSVPRATPAETSNVRRLHVCAEVVDFWSFADARVGTTTKVMTIVLAWEGSELEQAREMK